MITIRWATFAICLIILGVWVTGTRDVLLVILFALLFLVHVATYLRRRERPKRPVSNWFASDDPIYGAADEKLRESERGHMPKPPPRLHH